MKKKSKFQIGFIGAGKLGSAFAKALNSTGYEINGVASRLGFSAEKLAWSAGSKAQSVEEVIQASNLIFIVTNDDAIIEVVENAHWHTGQMVVHMSGALGLDVLNGAKSSGSDVASLHPIQTFAGMDENFKDVFFGLETASDPLRNILHEIVRDLEGQIVDISAANRALYHASAVMSCGYITTLLSDALIVWRAANLPYEEGVQALLQMTTTTLKNISEKGFTGALTGPIQRNDKTTVEKHLAAIKDHAPHLSDMYCSLGRRMTALAHQESAEDIKEWADFFLLNAERKT